MTTEPIPTARTAEAAVVRQQVLVLYLADSRLDSEVVGWTPTTAPAAPRPPPATVTNRPRPGVRVQCAVRGGRRTDGLLERLGGGRQQRR
ncbi:hypothetical protein ACIBJD_39230, partial [Kitasatospora sp. NPDC050467]